MWKNSVFKFLKLRLGLVFSPVKFRVLGNTMFVANFDENIAGQRRVVAPNISIADTFAGTETESTRAKMQARALRARLSYYFTDDIGLGREVLCPGRKSRPEARAEESSGIPGSRASLGRNFQLILKRAIDIVGAAFLLVLLSPILVLVAIAIRRESKGSAVFSQIRTGRDNKPFRILKFRTMHQNQCDSGGLRQAVSDDPRVTRIGKILRRNNFDELLQLINVLKGDMSLVGPRPHVPKMLAAGMLYEELVEDYSERHQVRPGITGLAQANGLRGPTTEPEPAALRTVMDLEYVRNFSIWLDIKIVYWTIVYELRRSNGF